MCFRDNWRRLFAFGNNLVLTFSHDHNPPFRVEEVRESLWEQRMAVKDIFNQLGYNGGRDCTEDSEIIYEYLQWDPRKNRTDVGERT